MKMPLHFQGLNRLKQMNKRGITLSVNFLVVIILALVILGFSVYFLMSVVSGAKGLADVTQDDLDKKIESIQCEGLVCVPVNYKQINAGKFDIFGVRVYNDGERRDFELKVDAYKTVPGIFYQPTNLTFNLRANEEKRIGIGFEVSKGTPAGIYIFNVRVYKANNVLHGSPSQIRVEVS
jgi:hypothetical protein